MQDAIYLGTSELVPFKTIGEKMQFIVPVGIGLVLMVIAIKSGWLANIPSEQNRIWHL